MSIKMKVVKEAKTAIYAAVKLIERHLDGRCGKSPTGDQQDCVIQIIADLKRLYTSGTADKIIVYTGLPQASLEHYVRFMERRPTGSVKEFQLDWRALLSLWKLSFDEPTAIGMGMGCEFMFALMTNQLEE